jgi:hypothetical protein
LQDHLAPMRAGAMLGDINPLPGAERSPPLIGICKDTPLSMALTWAGMSSGPSTSCTQPALAGAPGGGAQ